MRTVVLLFPLHTAHDISLTIVRSQNEHVKQVKIMQNEIIVLFLFFFKAALIVAPHWG